jgi:hypothetical protein
MVDGDDNCLGAMVMKTAGKRKITHGYVEQIFDDDGKIIEQKFVAGDQVEWEDHDGNPVTWQDHEYHPFDMIQPDPAKVNDPATHYLQSGGHNCPHCGSTEIHFGELDEQMSATYRPVRCSDCNREWTETFTMTGVTLNG